MLLSADVVAQVRQARAAFVRAFFGNFFRLLLVAVSVAQWGMVWWLFPSAVGTRPG